eukprot:15453400-Alexandrium_andersonii.AAC.1
MPDAKRRPALPEYAWPSRLKCWISETPGFVFDKMGVPEMLLSRACSHWASRIAGVLSVISCGGFRSWGDCLVNHCALEERQRAQRSELDVLETRDGIRGFR